MMYNLYANSTLLNTKPLTTEEVVNVMNKQFVYKKQKYTNELLKIPTKSIKVVKTIIV